MLPRLVAVLTLLLVLVPVAVTHAAGPGVHVDPGSPAGKEYAIPLDQARRDAGTPSRGTGSAGLFGAGITRGGSGGGPSGGATGGDRPRRAASAHVSRSSAKRRDTDRSSATKVGTPRTVPRVAPGDGGASSAGLLAALIAVVLAGGGLAAVVLRRVQRV